MTEPKPRRNGRSQRQKGDRCERAIVQKLIKAGIKAERVPLSGAQRYQGSQHDLDIYARGPDAAPLVCEVKARSGSQGRGFGTIEKWLGDYDALILKRDHKDPLVVLPWRIAMEFLKP